MKILHVLEISYPNVSGYSVRSHYLLKAQSLLGLIPVALTSPLHGQSINQKETFDGITYMRSGGLPRMPGGVIGRLLRFLLSSLKLINELRKIIKLERPDIIHFHSFYSVSPFHVWISRFWSRAPVVYEERGLLHEAGVADLRFSQRSLRYLAIRWNTRKSCQAADAVVTISSPLVDHIHLWNVPYERICLVPNGVDYDHFLSKRNLSPPTDLKCEVKDSFVIGFIGSIRKLEGLNLLLDALKILDCDRILGLIVGDGPELNKLRSQVQAKNLTKRVYFTGRVPHSEVPRYYRLLDLFCLCRPEETLTKLVPPLKGLEAMACRVPVLASDIPALREAVNYGSAGVLFPPGDANELARIISELMNNPKKIDELKDRGEEFVRSQRSWNVLAKKYCELYRSLLGN